ncbi:hypothetical protein [Pseudomonas zeae]|uniref:Nuclease-related domain-containing protein n=1 Tax=Pseudomonas zeae TaxID=2745510 RepID=A0ABU5BRN1_9PSED|nr:hypothetical protein [Pseudomonas zeae]MDX9679353.1 hypothetical protein [Pseudomonas zeae]
MIVASYTRELSNIKTDLSRYSHHSVFNCAINYLHNGRSMEHMPWVVMFLLKLSLLGESGSIEMNRDDFIRVANRVYRLSDKLIGIAPEVLMLMMRAMLVQQLWYQIPVTESWRQMILQRVLLERSPVFNNELFYNKVGITLNDYYKIANYLLTITGKQDPNAVVRWGMAGFYSNLSPAISDETLINFLKLVAIPFQNLPDYLKRYSVRDSNSAELYQETPLKNKPIILENDGLIIFNAGLCVSSLRSIAMDVLKPCPEFYGKFGVDVEHYIEERLRGAQLEVYSMSDLNKIIPIKIGKIADYVVVDGGDVFVFESKAITPSVLVRCSYDPAMLERYLKESFIKGIEQGQETAHKLSSVDKFKSKKTRIIVVTLEDFYIYGGDYISQYVKSDFEETLIAKYGCLPVQLQDVIYMTLKDLLTLTEWLKDKPAGSMSNLFNEIEEASKQPGGGRFSISPHISEKIGGEVMGVVGVGDALERTREEMEQLLLTNSRIRRSQHPASFMNEFEQFRSRLRQSFR